MQSIKEIRTITSYSEFKFKEKCSEFIGQAFPCGSIHSADEILNSTKKKYHNATHNCFAYNIFRDQIRYSDDGEPSGTAGIRILNAINHFELLNVLIIATRFYGGTKLGVGPLGKAYYDAAVGAVNNAKIITKFNYSKVRIQFDFEHSSSVHHFINQLNAREIKNLFEKKPVIECSIIPENLNSLESNLTQISRGKIKVSLIEEDIFLLCY